MFVLSRYQFRFPKTEGGFPRRQRPTEAAGERGMEPVSGDPLLRELLRFAVRCRALALLLQASLPSPETLPRRLFAAPILLGSVLPRAL